MLVLVKSEVKHASGNVGLKFAFAETLNCWTVKDFFYAIAAALHHHLKQEQYKLLKGNVWFN